MSSKPGKSELINGNKKPFNKKLWREQKYSCKTKVQNWDNIKRRQAERKLNQEHKHSKPQFNPLDRRKNPEQNRQGNSLKEAALKFRELQAQKKRKKEEQERIRQQRLEAIALRKQKKAERYKKICQKTRKGQPLMRGRIELLLEKIQSMVSKSEN